MLMLDLLISLIALFYFTTTINKYDSCYYSALIYNIVHICSHLIILPPLFLKLIRRKTLTNIRR